MVYITSVCILSCMYYIDILHMSMSYINIPYINIPYINILHIIVNEITYFCLSILARVIYGSFCKAENEITNVVDYRRFDKSI